jgi:hypothetical protein
VEAGADLVADAVLESVAPTRCDTTACLLFIHHIAPENAATATTSNPADWKSIGAPAAAAEGAGGSAVAWDTSIAGWPHRHCVCAGGTRRPHTGHTQLELIDLLSVSRPVLSTTKDTKDTKDGKKLKGSSLVSLVSFVVKKA